MVLGNLLDAGTELMEPIMPCPLRVMPLDRVWEEDVHARLRRLTIEARAPPHKQQLPTALRNPIPQLPCAPTHTHEQWRLVAEIRLPDGKLNETRKRPGVRKDSPRIGDGLRYGIINQIVRRTAENNDLASGRAFIITVARAREVQCSQGVGRNIQQPCGNAVMLKPRQQIYRTETTVEQRGQALACRRYIVALISQTFWFYRNIALVRKPSSSTSTNRGKKLVCDIRLPPEHQLTAIHPRFIGNLSGHRLQDAKILRYGADIGHFAVKHNVISHGSPLYMPQPRTRHRYNLPKKTDVKTRLREFVWVGITRPPSPAAPASGPST